MQVWQKDLARSITSVEDLAKKIKLTKSELSAASRAEKNFSLLITPFYLDLLKKEKSNGPIHKQIIPTIDELSISIEELDDPIGDNKCSPIKGLVHRYSDRVLVWPTKNCALHCRFCFRKRIVGDIWGLNDAEVRNILSYIKKHHEVEEVIFSGGDPFMLSDKQLFFWMKELNKIEHIKRIRFHTRLFSALPSRFTAQLFKKIQIKKPIYIVLHVNHPSEITKKFVSVAEQARKCGILLFSQTVLLKDINNDVNVLKKLFSTLLDNGVKPYYLHHTDKVQGTSHLRVTLTEGKKIMKGLQGDLTGLALPKYMIEIPDGPGKVPIDLGFI